MFISQALTKIKNLKSKLARIDKIIDSCVTRYEDDEEEYNYSDEVGLRTSTIHEIIELKIRVQLTNTTVNVSYKDASMTLAQAILMNADLRSEMAFITKQLNVGLEVDEGWRVSKRSKDDVKKVYANGYNKNELRIYLEKLEANKEEMDGLMASTNASTMLV